MWTLPFSFFFNSSLLWDVFIINSVEQLQTLPKTQSEIDISPLVDGQNHEILKPAISGLYILFHPVYRPCFYFTRKQMTPFYSQALEFRTPLFPHLVPLAIMVWIFVWKYIFEPFIHILQHFMLQISRSTNFCF